MYALSNFGATMLATSLELTGLEPVLWGMAVIIGVCVAVLGYDALNTPAGIEASILRRSPARHDRHDAVVALEQAA